MKEIEAKMASERATLESLQQKMQSMQVAKEDNIRKWHSIDFTHFLRD